MENLVVETPTGALLAKASEHGMLQIHEEIVGLVDFLRSRGSLRNVLEIGSESGGTFYLWCRLAALGGHKISLDQPWGPFADPTALDRRTALFKSWSANVSVVTGDSHNPDTNLQVARILRKEQLDFLFIDGDHSYEGVKADWELYREFVRPGGLVAFHDINHLGPAQLWPEITLPKREFNQHQNWGGIGVVTI